MELDFLSVNRPKVVRTRMYGDQEFSAWELELLHTPVMQRLYDLKQLGFADRVYPDAVHSRFNHILGVAEVAERMAKRLVEWLSKNESHVFDYADESAGPLRENWETRSITAKDLATAVEARFPVVRLIGLLHDLTHAAYGHTLEDEVCVFVEKHDDPPRQIRFFNALLGQLLYLWTVEAGVRDANPDEIDRLVQLEVSERDVVNWAHEIAAVHSTANRAKLAQNLRHLQVACTLLGYIEYLHETNQDRVPSNLALYFANAIDALDRTQPPLDVILHRDAFLIDIVGNTICADLLDYARRDAENAGLRVQFDDRLMRYVCNVSVTGDLSPTGKPCIRIALQFFTDKMRYDVLSEMSGILKARYLITERILFHPTKCAAGAMLGTATQMLGIDKVPSWMQIVGDQEFVRLLIEVARRMAAELNQGAREQTPARPGDRLSELVSTNIEGLRKKLLNTELLVKRIEGARVLLWKLVSRRYPKLVYRLGGGVNHGRKENDETIAAKYNQPHSRFDLEREVERRCNLPAGSVVVHCPRRKTSMKVAQAIVVGADLNNAVHLRDVNKITPELLRPYNDEIRAVENMYRAIWQLHVYLDSSQVQKRKLVESVLSDLMHFPNDELLLNAATPDNSSPYTLLVEEFRNDFPRNRLTKIVQRLDAEGARRMRHGDDEPARDRTRRIILEIEAEHVAAPSTLDGDAPEPDSGQLSIFENGDDSHRN